MEKPADRMLRSMCQFLASGSKEKLVFLPDEHSSLSYMYNECGHETRNPLYYYCSAACELMSRYQGGRQDEFSDLILDINAMLSIMFDHWRQDSFLWELDKENCIVAGAADRFWTVLQRLATLALSARGWPKTYPEIPFIETGWSGEFQDRGAGSGDARDRGTPG
jgi:hypothetical protein